MDTPTQTMPDWPALWAREEAGAVSLMALTDPPKELAREPGLRPLDESDMIDVDGLPGYDCISRVHRGVYAKVFAALCRDAAVRWLADQTCSSEVSFYTNGGTEPARVTVHMWRPGLGVTTDPREYAGDSLDAALFAACDAVLRAEGK